MKEIYNGETVALGGVNLVTKQVIVDDSTGEKANFTYDKTTGSITVLDEVDPDSVNPVTARAVAQAVAGASGEVPIIGDNDNGKVLKAVVSGGQKSAEWGEAAPAVTVDQHFDASSANPQSCVAVSEGIYLNRPLTTTQASGTEIDIDVKGDAPIKLVAEDYGSEAGPSVAATFKVAQVRPVGPTSGPRGVEVIFDLPAPQHFPINAQLTIAEDISGSNPSMYQLDRDSYFAAAVDDTISINGYSPMSFQTADADQHTILAGTYNLAITSGNPYFEFSQVGITFNGNGAPGAWEEIRDYIIANASTLFSLSLPSTVKTARLLPAATSSDADKVLTVNSTGKPVWAAVPGGSAITYLNGTESAKDIMDMLDAGAFPVYKETTVNAANDTTYRYYTVTRTHSYVDDQSMPAYSLTLTCLYPNFDPDQRSAIGYVGRIAGYRIIGSTWTKTDVQVI